MTEPSLLLELKWESIALDVLDRTEKFPRTARYSIAQRVDNLVLDVMEALVEGRYRTGKRRRDALDESNLLLSRLRVLIRLAHRRGLLAEKGYEFVSQEIDEAGRMLGGWKKRLGTTSDQGAGGSGPGGDE